jgi:hypothetical protein
VVDVVHRDSSGVIETPLMFIRLAVLAGYRVVAEAARRGVMRPAGSGGKDRPEREPRTVPWMVHVGATGLTWWVIGVGWIMLNP